jgi:hypothetical protein
MKRLAFLLLLVLAPVAYAPPAFAASKSVCILDYPKQQDFGALGPVSIEYHDAKSMVAGTITISLAKPVPAYSSIRVNFVCE